MKPKPSLLKPTGLFEEDNERASEDDDDMFTETVRQKSEVKQLRLPNLQAMVESKATTAESNEERPWLRPGLVLRCCNPDLAGGRYAQRLGISQRVVEEGWGVELKMVESQDVILLDQDDCQSTLPKAGDPVVVVRGEYAGERGRFKELSADGKDAVVEIAAGKRSRLVSLPKPDVCAFVPL